MPVMVWVWDWELDRLKDQGIIVTCSQCQYPVDTGPRTATCPILRTSVLLDQPLICSAFKERSS